MFLARAFGSWRDKKHFTVNRTSDLVEVMKKVQRAWKQHEMTFYTQDLSGFFVSVPHDRILEAVRWLLEQYDELSQLYDKKPLNSQVFTVPKSKTVRGEGAQLVKITVGDIMPVVNHLLKETPFRLGNMVFRQKLGSCIGSPLSPTLCQMVVMAVEIRWTQSAPKTLTQKSDLGEFLVAMRYVDNRGVWIKTDTVHSTDGTIVSESERNELEKQINVLTDPEFYTSPVILEDEPRDKLLGADLIKDIEVGWHIWGSIAGFDELETKGACVKDQWKYRVGASVSGQTGVYGTVIARLFLIQSRCSSTRLKEISMARLMAVMLSLKIHQKTLTKALNRCKDMLNIEKTRFNRILNIIQLRPQDAILVLIDEQRKWIREMEIDKAQKQCPAPVVDDVSV